MRFGYFFQGGCLKTILFNISPVLLASSQALLALQVQRAELGWQPGRVCPSPPVPPGLLSPQTPTCGTRSSCKCHMRFWERSPWPQNPCRTVYLSSLVVRQHQVFCVPEAPRVLEGFLGFCLYRVVLVCTVGSASLSQCSLHILMERTLLFFPTVTHGSMHWWPCIGGHALL